MAAGGDGIVAASRAARHAGDAEGALRLLQAAAPPPHERIAVLLETAASLAALGRPGEAADTYAAILRDTPGSVPALRGLGRLAVQRGDAAAARAHFQQALAQRPGDIAILSDIADAQLSAGQPEAAIALLRPVCGAAGRPGRRPMMLLARAYGRSGDTAAAERAWHDVLARHGEGAAALIALAQLAAERGDNETAFALTGRAIACQPAEPALRQELARLLLRLNRPEQARALIEAWLRAAEDVSLRLSLADILCAQGDVASGLDQLRSLMDAQLSPGARLSLAAALNRQNALAEAEAVLRAAVAAQPYARRAWRELGVVLRRQGCDTAALEAFQHASGLDPADAQAACEVAETLEVLQRSGEAHAILARLEASGDAAARERALTKRLEFACAAGRTEEALAITGAYPDLRDMPAPMVRWAAALHALRDDWPAVLRLFAERVVTGRGTALVPADAMLTDRVLTAARQLGRQAEVLALAAHWPAAHAPRAQLLRDSLTEELHVLGLLRGGTAPAAPLDAMRASRCARLAAALAAPSPGVDGTILLCSDRAYLTGAAVSLGALLRHNAPALRRCRFRVVLHDDALEPGRPLFARLGAAHAVTIEVVEAASLSRAASGLRLSWGYSANALVPALSEAMYDRILAALHFAEAGERGRLLYIDCDTCPGPGIAALLRMDMRGQPLAARPEQPWVGGAARAARKLGIPVQDYFNSGVLLLDLGHPALPAGLQRALDIAATAPEKLSNPDQCALNLAFHGQTTALPPSGNAFVRPTEPLEDFPDPAILHFLGRPKPWDAAYPTANNDRWVDEFRALAEVLPGSDLRMLLELNLVADAPPQGAAPAPAAPAPIRAATPEVPPAGGDQTQDLAAHALQARAAAARGDVAASLASWQAAQRFYPDHQAAWQPGLAQALMQADRFEEAASLFAGAYAVRGNTAALAGQAMAVGQTSPAAAEALWSAVARQSSAALPAGWLLSRAKARMDAGDEAHAMALLDGALRGQADLPDAIYTLWARLLIKLGQRGRLAGEVEQGVLREGGGAGPIARCHAQFLLRQPGEARASFTAALEQPPTIWGLTQLLFLAPRVHAQAELAEVWRRMRGQAASLAGTAQMRASCLHMRLDLALRDHDAFLARYAAMPLVPARWHGRFARIAAILQQTPQDDAAPKIFGIGLARTGTTSLGAALQHLGYLHAHNSNPFTEALLDDADFPLFDSANDTPVTLRFAALDARYPNARFILTERPVDAWEASISAYFGAWRGMPDCQTMQRLSGTDDTAYGSGLAAIDAALYIAHGDFRSAYRAHADNVARHFAGRPGKLLRHNVFDGDGWEKLCAFLGKQVPDAPYPRENTGVASLAL
jgi:lipopolysaccharide biosynthesis glycosyltransferase/tetratricopeptide (TPR) repeat protein